MSPEGQVIATAREMLRRGLVTGTAGNVSMRHDGGMLLTPTRRHPDDLLPHDLVWIPLDGPGAVSAQASLEWRMHAAIYRDQDAVGGIVHTHSPYATARSFDPSPLTVKTEERVYNKLDRFLVAPPAPAGSSDLARGAADALMTSPAALLAEHGVVGVGLDPRAALELCTLVEHQALIAHVRSNRRRPRMARSTT